VADILWQKTSFRNKPPNKKCLFVHPRETTSNKSTQPAAVGWFKASSSIIVAVRYLVSYLYRKPVLAGDEKGKMHFGFVFIA